MNRAVKQVTDKHLNVVVADWDKAIDRHREFLADDGIHPGPGGARIYASTVAKALATLPVNR